MKKLILAVLSVILLGSCSSKNDNNASDSAANDSVNNETEKPDDFISPDLAWQDFKGHVKLCVANRYEAVVKNDSIWLPKNETSIKTDSVEFSNDGLLTSLVSLYYSGNSQFSTSYKLRYDENGKFKGGEDVANGLKINLTRDASGYVKLFEGKGKNNEGMDDFRENYEWKDGLLVSFDNCGWEWRTVYKYTYDTSGYVAECNSLFEEYEDGVETIEKYRYTKFDKNGNWTERYVSCSSVDVNFDFETGDLVNRHNKTEYIFIDRRNITMY